MSQRTANQQTAPKKRLEELVRQQESGSAQPIGLYKTHKATPIPKIQNSSGTSGSKASRREAKNKDHFTGPTVLVIGNPNITRSIGKVLQNQHYNFFEAASTEDGLTLTRWVKPDVILLDDSLTNREPTALDEIQSTENGVNTPIIHMAQKEPCEIFSTRVDDNLTKPFNSKQLLKKLTLHAVN